ncbi:hypothetical protein AAFC00_004311 [Neodothiora populina]|uniref:Uncharacterized protein n=1 Tax=Neodothiora populina TaxID=2781224 RepID=A0ABR3PKD3_9PEZI
MTHPFYLNESQKSSDPSKRFSVSVKSRTSLHILFPVNAQCSFFIADPIAIPLLHNPKPRITIAEGPKLPKVSPDSRRIPYTCSRKLLVDQELGRQTPVRNTQEPDKAIANYIQYSSTYN